MEMKLKMIYRKGEKFWVGKLLEHPEIMTQGETLEELEHAFKFNDAVLRHLTVKMDRAVTEPSPMMKEEKAKNLLDTAAQEGAAEAPAAAE